MALQTMENVELGGGALITRITACHVSDLITWRLEGIWKETDKLGHDVLPCWMCLYGIGTMA